MSRLTLLTLLSVAVAQTLASAQVLTSPTKQQNEASQTPAPETLSLHAAASPDPLLRYRLWPAPEHRIRDNATTIVNRSVILTLQIPPKSRNELADRYSEWSEMPIGDLPIKDVRRVLATYQSALDELARVENVMMIEYDIQLDQLSAPEMIATFLPEFQEMRHLARLIGLRARVAIAEERWDDAVHDCRIGFRLAEVCGYSTDFLVGRLVGFAISGTMFGVLEEAMQQPACPNLYWALASLPEQRLFETRDSIEFESVPMSRVFDCIGVLPDQPIGPVAAREKIRQLIREAGRTTFSATSRPNASSAELLAGMYVVTLAEPSRELLAATKAWGERASTLSAPEAVLRATQLKFARARDQWVAWSLLPPEVWDEYGEERMAALRDTEPNGDLLVSLIRSLTPAVDAARNAGLRTEQQRNWLATIEALRMHAATNGMLPATLEDLRPVPTWRDAITLRPFGYQRSAPTRATLTRAPRFSGDTETSFTVELKGTK
ncbi:MAG: hypothetical protein ACR2NZ_21300 [Rubripirellula sp.]